MILTLQFREKEELKMKKNPFLFRNIPFIISLSILAIFSACSPDQEQDSQPNGQLADLIFVGDNIITMEGSNAGAVAVIGDRIVSLGNEKDVLQLRGESTRIIELGERALLPGFIDAHGHFGAVAVYSALLDLSSDSRTIPFRYLSEHHQGGPHSMTIQPFLFEHVHTKSDHLG